ncbi:TFIIB-type zinc ribbon-containing protein [Actinosynnema pretiosum]|uniref:Transcriptional regulator n=1 Tax=Actinosynnema pretiosum TaxID=42197 RepID=A0A290ZF07_9PSEU|nr:zf-TFIIB domain-containing protein [Actinosynnema pretiosum]ATE57606.1 transcriptional regulator [Actinosynnema pretiosum]
MICPKCQDLMKTITRGAVHIDQCENCRGVFLDGGELEQIVAAERAHYGQAATTGAVPGPGGDQGAPPPYQPAGADPAATTHFAPGRQPGAPPPYQPPPGSEQPAAPAPGHAPGYGYGQPGYGYPPRRRSFLEQLFD